MSKSDKKYIQQSASSKSSMKQCSTNSIAPLGCGFGTLEYPRPDRFDYVDESKNIMRKWKKEPNFSLHLRKVVCSVTAHEREADNRSEE